MLDSWFKHLLHSITDEGGYWIVIGILVAFISAYAGVYTIVEARHEWQMNRALFEQNRFMTLAASGSPGGLNAALAEYESLKARGVLKSPDIWRVWT